MQRNSSSLRWPLAFAAAVLVLGTGWYRESRDRARDQAAIDARLSSLEQAPRLVDDGSRRSRQGLQEPPRPAPMGASATGPSGWGAPRPPSSAERQRLQVQALNHLESRFAADGYDPRWAASTENAIATAAADGTLAAFQAPAASEVRCARTMCRLVFSFDTLDQAEDWSSYYPLGVAKGLPAFRSVSTVRPDGRVELRMYGFRSPSGVPRG